MNAFVLPFGANDLIPVKAEFTHFPKPTTAKVTSCFYSPEYEMWEKIVSARKIPKVVLARRCTLLLDHAPNPFALCAALPNKGAQKFCFQWDKGAFFGATPERLYKREGRDIAIDALAGTGKLGEKELREFLFVQEFIQEKMKALCEQFSFSEIHEHHTANVRHFKSTGKGLLKEHVTDIEIIHALHPTPAISGFPQDQALSFIKTQEPFERGLYAGLIGTMSRNQAEFFVMIRSCYLEGNIAHIYSGAGIVDGSNAKEEWDELDAKLKLFDAVLDRRSANAPGRGTLLHCSGVA